MKLKKTIACLLAASLVSGPVDIAFGQSQPPGPPPQGSGEGCNTAGVAILGALAGALLGGKNNRLKGAAIGGGVAAAICVAYNYHAKQTRNAQQVTTEYIEKHDNQPPPSQSVVSEYTSKFDPTNQIKAGQSTALDSTIAVVPGTDGVAPVVEEEITMYGPDGKQLRTMRKPANSNGQGGEFQTQFAFKMPDGVQQGIYNFKTAVYLNNVKMQEGSAQLQVV